MAQRMHHFDVLCFPIYCCCWRLSLWVVLNYFLCYIGMDVPYKYSASVYSLASINCYKSAILSECTPIAIRSILRKWFLFSTNFYFFLKWQLIFHRVYTNKKNSNVIRTMSEVISQIYRKRQCCFDIHLNWEKFMQVTDWIKIPLKNTFMI